MGEGHVPEDAKKTTSTTVQSSSDSGPTGAAVGPRGDNKATNVRSRDAALPFFFDVSPNPKPSFLLLHRLLSLPTPSLCLGNSTLHSDDTI
ncbi:hypothetical protein BHE74_00056495 [Ensete ventricosum]|nr:hypothetical protein BHE74_00056495 [Ensete ventricosum]